MTQSRHKLITRARRNAGCYSASASSRAGGTPSCKAQRDVARPSLVSTRAYYIDDQLCVAYVATY